MKVKDFIDAGGKVDIDPTFTTLSVPGFFGKNAVKIPTRYLFSMDEDENEILEHFIKTLYNLFLRKSPEQIAAEESVRKAEEALEAAKTTLEKIKEK